MDNYNDTRERLRLMVEQVFSRLRANDKLNRPKCSPTETRIIHPCTCFAITDVESFLSQPFLAEFEVEDAYQSVRRLTNAEIDYFDVGFYRSSNGKRFWGVSIGCYSPTPEVSE
jgi:hypothetical protein